MTGQPTAHVMSGRRAGALALGTEGSNTLQSRRAFTTEASHGTAGMQPTDIGGCPHRSRNCSAKAARGRPA